MRFIEPPLSTELRRRRDAVHLSPFSKGENPGKERGLPKKASSNRRSTLNPQPSTPNAQPPTHPDVSQAPSLLFINQHYWPDLAATAQMLTDLAEHLAGDGVEVHVLCSRGHYLGDAMDVPAEETHQGVHIHRVRATAFGRGGTLGRLTDYASFYTRALAHVLTGPSYDYVVTLTTPPLLPLVGTLAKRLRGQHYGIWSMDLHPDAEVASGMLDEDGILARGLHALNDAGYRNAEFVVDLGRYMKARITDKGVAPDKTHTIPVWSRGDEIAPVPHADNPLRNELGLEDKFVVMYSGNAGMAHRFDEVLEAMERLKDHPAIEFVFVGEGPRKDEILRFVNRRGIDNFRYLSYFPQDQLRYSLSLADVHLLTLQPNMAGIAVPGKLYGIMAAGRPVLMVGPEATESAETIQQHGAGHVIDPARGKDAVQRLHDAIMELYADKQKRKRMGANGRSAFLESFEQKVCCRLWQQHLQRTLQKKVVAQR